MTRAGGRVGERWINRAVEHHRPDVLGEQLRVYRAEEGAVRLADIRQLLVTERGAEILTLP